MREYVVLLRYERGVHPVRDIFIDHPDLVATSLAISAYPGTSWRVERITGPEEALDALETVYINPEICNECIYPHSACDAKHEYEVLESEPTARTIYRSTTEETFCFAVSVLAMSTLGVGLVFNTAQRGPYYEWRILIPENRDLGEFHEALHSDLPAGVTLTVRRVGSLEPWQGSSQSLVTDIPYEQRKALETATRLGYYKHPREATLEDIAAELTLPVTTLRYRLRRAEAWIIGRAQRNSLTEDQAMEGPPPSALTDLLLERD